MPADAHQIACAVLTRNQKQIVGSLLHYFCSVPYVTFPDMITFAARRQLSAAYGQVEVALGVKWHCAHGNGSDEMVSGNPGNSGPRQPTTASPGKELSDYGARRSQAVERGFAVLEWLMANPATATVRDVSEALGLRYDRCYRLVNSLLASGYLVRSEGRRMRPGPAFLRLFPVYLREGGPKELESVATALRDETRESTYVAVWDGQDVVLVHAIDGLSNVRVTGYDPGFKEGAYARATGKAILAYLPPEELDRYLATHDLIRYSDNTTVDESELRAQFKVIQQVGLAEDHGELHPGVSAVGVPVFGASGQVVGGVAIASPAQSFDASSEMFRDSLMWAGERASRILGYRGAYPKLP